MCRSIYDTSPFPAAAYSVYYNLVVTTLDVGHYCRVNYYGHLDIKRRMVVRKIHIRRSISIKHNFDH